MTVQLIIFLIALAAIIFFFKNFNACVYFVVMIDIFLRIVTYLKVNVIKAEAFEFLDFLPSDVPAIWQSFNFGGVFDSIMMIIYLIVYIIFEVLLIRMFIRRKF